MSTINFSNLPAVHTESLHRGGGSCPHPACHRRLLARHVATFALNLPVLHSVNLSIYLAVTFGAAYGL